MATIEDVYKFFKEEASTYFLATVDEDGNPRVRAFGTVDLFEGKLYIQTGKAKPVYQQVLAHPRPEGLKKGRRQQLAGHQLRARARRPRRGQKAYAGQLPRLAQDVRRERRQHHRALHEGCHREVRVAGRQACRGRGVLEHAHAWERQIFPLLQFELLVFFRSCNEIVAGADLFDATYRRSGNF